MSEREIEWLKEERDSARKERDELRRYQAHHTDCPDAIAYRAERDAAEKRLAEVEAERDGFRTRALRSESVLHEISEAPWELVSWVMREKARAVLEGKKA